ncbi:MAG: leucine-rich repeat protein [Clostridia bacterium]|nr:leucine-rich repeat protein [Clostridia bacterium]
MKKLNLRRSALVLAGLMMWSALATLTGCDALFTPEETAGSTAEAPDLTETTPENEAATEAETLPPVRTESFTDESLLSLFSAEQGNLSLSEDGELVAEASWKEGDPTRSCLVFDPLAVMKAIEPHRTGYPGAVVIKARRVKTMPETPTVHPGNQTFGRLEDLDPLPVYRNAVPDSPYEYFVIDTSAPSLMEGMTPELYVEWVCIGDTTYGSEGRSLTVREISFHSDIWEAFFDIKEDMDEAGVNQPVPNYWEYEDQVLFNSTVVRVPFLYLKPRGPMGQLIDRITGACFTDSPSMTVAVLGEGFDLLSDRCLGENENLAAVYLPDSLTRLKGDPFAFCPKLTRIRLGRGIKTIDDYALTVSSLTDIDYNGTMEQWCQVDRGIAKNCTVHCLDGDIPYGAKEPDYGQGAAAAYELAWSTPLQLAEGQIALSVEHTRLTLSDGADTEREVILRWALTRPAVADESLGCRYIPYFDVLSPEDGSVLYVLSQEERLAYSHGMGNGLLLSRGAKEEGMAKTATLFLAGYGFTEGGDGFRVQVTHFHLELDGEGKLTVNRNAGAKLNADVTVPFPMTGYGDLNKTRQIFRDIESYIVKTHDLGNLNPSYLLLVSRPHGDGAIRNLGASASAIDGFFFGAMWQTLSPDIFNKESLSVLYDRYGALKSYQKKS